MITLTYTVNNTPSDYPVQLYGPENLHKKIVRHIHPDSIIHMNKVYQCYTTKYRKEIFTAYYNILQSLGCHKILIHGPCSMKQYISAIKVLPELDKNKIIIETPSITSALQRDLYNGLTPLQFMINYVCFIRNMGFEMCYDTAHLYASGLNTKDILTLFKMYPVKYVHLNGNTARMGQMDKHGIIYEDNNNMDYKYLPLLYKELVKHKCICIFELYDDTIVNNKSNIDRFIRDYKFVNYCIPPSVDRYTR